MNKYQLILPNNNNNNNNNNIIKPVNYTANIINENPTLYNGDNNKLQSILRELKKREYQKKIKKNIHSIQNVKTNEINNNTNINNNQIYNNYNTINNNNNNNIDYIVPKYNIYNSYVDGYNNINNNYIKSTFSNYSSLNNQTNKTIIDNQNKIIINNSNRNNNKSIKVNKSNIKSFSFLNKSLPPLPKNKINDDSVVPIFYKSFKDIKQTSEPIYLVPKYSSSCRFSLPSIQQLKSNDNSSLDLPPISRSIIE